MHNQLVLAITMVGILWTEGGLRFSPYPAIGFHTEESTGYSLRRNKGFP